MKTLIAALVGAVCFSAAATPAAAYSECQASVDYLYFGDSGTLYIYLTDGVVGVILNNNPDKSSYLSIALTAKTANRPLVIRVAADGAACSGYRNDVVGLGLR